MKKTWQPTRVSLTQYMSPYHILTEVFLIRIRRKKELKGLINPSETYTQTSLPHLFSKEQKREYVSNFYRYNSPPDKTQYIWRKRYKSIFKKKIIKNDEK